MTLICRRIRVFLLKIKETYLKLIKWKNINENDLVKMIEKSEKKRHEISNGKVRAFYGHSIPIKIVKEEKIPPDILYHGTARRFLDSIKENGLLPQC